MNTILYHLLEQTPAKRVILFSSLANNILEFDSAAKAKGFNTLKGITCMGVSLYVVDINGNRTAWLEPKSRGGVVRSHQTISKSTLESSICDTVPNLLDSHSIFLESIRYNPNLTVYLKRSVDSSTMLVSSWLRRYKDQRNFA